MFDAELATIVSRVEKEQADHGVLLVEAKVNGPANRPNVELRFDSVKHIDAITSDELDACQEWVSRLLDEVDPFATSYTLEVSSPGLDRILGSDELLGLHMGERVSVRATAKIDGVNASKATGTLASFDPNTLTLEIDSHEIEIPRQTIKEIRLKPTTEELFQRKDA